MPCHHNLEIYLTAYIDAIEITTHAGLRDRALIGLMVFSFARIGAALGMGCL